jgi:hypothetical protein
MYLEVRQQVLQDQVQRTKEEAFILRFYKKSVF